MRLFIFLPCPHVINKSYNVKCFETFSTTANNVVCLFFFFLSFLSLQEVGMGTLDQSSFYLKN